MLPVSNTKQKATQTLSLLLCASCLFVKHFLGLLFFFACCVHCEASFRRPLAVCRPWCRARTAKWLLRHWVGVKECLFFVAFKPFLNKTTFCTKLFAYKTFGFRVLKSKSRDSMPRNLVQTYNFLISNCY